MVTLESEMESVGNACESVGAGAKGGGGGGGREPGSNNRVLRISGD